MFSTWVIVTRESQPSEFKQHVADYSYYYRLFYLVFPAAALVVGENKLYYFCLYCKTMPIELIGVKVVIVGVDVFKFQNNWEQIIVEGSSYYENVTL